MSRIRGVMVSLMLSIAMPALAAEPIALRDMGSFHIGGRLVEISGKPVKEVVFTQGGVPAKIDPNGTYQVEQMYVQYFLPANEKGAYPLLMWHGGGLTGEPVFLTTANPFERFRIGAAGSYDPDPAKRKLLPGSQFPNEGYENFTKQNVPRWTTNDDATLAAYIAEIDRVCPCVILFHSQAGSFGFKAAQARPDKVKALIAVEPASVGDPAKVETLKNIPTLMLYGDYIERDSRWPKIRATGLAFADGIRAAGGSADVVDLPKAGIKGNSHMMMMDKNNAEVAALIQTWLQGKGLTKKP